MSVTIATLVLTFALLLAGGLWIGLSMMATGIFGLEMFHTLPVDKVLAQNLFNTISSTELLALPLFILMAEVLFRTRISDHMFSGLAPWTTRLPGRLLHINVIASTLFAAVSGSSAATTATVGRITLSELDKRGYDRTIAIWLAGRRRHYRFSDPAKPADDRLRRVGRGLHSQAIHRRHRTGTCARLRLLADDYGALVHARGIVVFRSSALYS
ncbi:MAG: hypothetical protein Rhirs2KO_25640 [Rhizobiaceae bacterium]